MTTHAKHGGGHGTHVSRESAELKREQVKQDVEADRKAELADLAPVPEVPAAREAVAVPVDWTHPQVASVPTHRSEDLRAHEWVRALVGWKCKRQGCPGTMTDPSLSAEATCAA